MEKINLFDYDTPSFEPVRVVRKGLVHKGGKAKVVEFTAWVMPFLLVQRFEALKYAESLVAKYLGYPESQIAPTAQYVYTAKVDDVLLRNIAFLEYSIGLAFDHFAARRRAGEENVPDCPTYTDVELVQMVSVMGWAYQALTEELDAANRRANRFDEAKDNDPKGSADDLLSPPHSSSD